MSLPRGKQEEENPAHRHMLARGPGGHIRKVGRAVLFTNRLFSRLTSKKRS